MGFYRNWSLPRLDDWQQASKFEQHVVPIRGRYPECKPLGQRRHTHLSIHRDEQDTVACKLYMTDVVKFRKDNTIIVNPKGYASLTTLDFIGLILGKDTTMHDNRLWIKCYGVNRQGFGWLPLNKDGENIFVRDKDGCLTFVNYKLPVVHTVVRSKAKNVRKLYAPFIKYLRNSLKIRDEGFGVQEFADTFGVKDSRIDYPPTLKLDRLPREVIAEFLKLAISEQPEDQYRASLWLAYSAAHTDSYWGFNHSLQTGWFKPTNMNHMKQLFDMYIMYIHRDEMFEATTVTSGELVRDRYKKYFD